MTRSPDGQHRADLRFEGEIRFGPEYFRLSIDARTVPNRIFGQPLQWSADSRFLAAQEWLTTDSAKGPITCAALIDVDAWKIARLQVLPKGFAEAFRFGDGVLVYRKTFAAQGIESDAEVALGAIDSWQDIHAPPIPCADA